MGGRQKDGQRVRRAAEEIVLARLHGLLAPLQREKKHTILGPPTMSLEDNSSGQDVACERHFVASDGHYGTIV
jgi:hypothetical protein